jgi:hypothetical protein
MAKGQKRSNREAKKPKQPKPERSVAASLGAVPAPAARNRATVDGGDRTGGRNGRR